jgi:hypothetical protein
VDRPAVRPPPGAHPPLRDRLTGGHRPSEDDGPSYRHRIPPAHRTHRRTPGVGRTPAGVRLLPCCPRLAAGLVPPGDCVSWANAIGRRFRLQLHPHPTVRRHSGLLAGAQPRAPAHPRIRVNLSVPHTELTAALAVLRTAQQR